MPLDLEAGSVISQLASGGLDLARPAFVSWLGVTMYLTREAISQALAGLGRLAPGTELVTDYMLPAELRDADGTAYADLVMPSAAEWGEPWLSCFAPGADVGPADCQRVRSPRRTSASATPSARPCGSVPTHCTPSSCLFSPTRSSADALPGLPVTCAAAGTLTPGPALGLAALVIAHDEVLDRTGQDRVQCDT